jgi:hypothetical protein
VYRKFDSRSVECFKLGAAVPARVSGGSYRWDAKTKLLHVDSHARDVLIVFKQETRSSEK